MRNLLLKLALYRVRSELAKEGFDGKGISEEELLAGLAFISRARSYGFSLEEIRDGLKSLKRRGVKTVSMTQSKELPRATVFPPQDN